MLVFPTRRRTGRSRIVQINEPGNHRCPPRLQPFIFMTQSHCVINFLREEYVSTGCQSFRTFLIELPPASIFTFGSAVYVDWPSRCQKNAALLLFPAKPDCTGVSLSGQTKSPRSPLPFIPLCVPLMQTTFAVPCQCNASGLVFLFFLPSLRYLSYWCPGVPSARRPTLSGQDLTWLHLSPACPSFTLALASPSSLCHSSLPLLLTRGPAGPGVSTVLRCIFRPQHFPSAPECLFSHCQL